MKKQFDFQCILFCILIIIIGFFNRLIPYIGIIHEFGHYITANYEGYEAEIKSPSLTIINDCIKPSLNILMSGHYASIFIYFILSIIVVLCVPYKIFAISGISCGLFLGELFFVSIPGILINNDFEKAKTLYKINPYSQFLFYGIILFIILSILIISRISTTYKYIAHLDELNNRKFII